MNLPTRAECFRLLEEHGLCGEFEHIRQHSIIVNRVAVWLATKLKEAGVDVNVDLVDRGSLLHDIAKVLDIKAGNVVQGKHDEQGYALLNDGYPDVAKLVLRHVVFRVAECETWEQKVLMYADMRVFHRSVVGLDARVDYLRTRYFTDKDAQQRLDDYVKQLREIEAELFGLINGQPADVLQLNSVDA